MRRIVMAALAAFSVCGVAGGAQAATGSGQVHFNFTHFDGPFALVQPSGDVNDPSTWLLSGLVNGSQPTLNGHNTDDGQGNTNIGGNLAISGQATTLVYGNVPSAVASVISFTPDSFSSISTGEAFRLGTISFTNGQWLGGSTTAALNAPVTLSFHLSTTSGDQPAFNQGFDDSFTIVTNQAGDVCDTLAGQQDEADFIYLSSHPQFGSLRVFDQACKPAAATNVGTVELWAKFGSLDLLDFRSPGQSGFLTDSVAVGPIGGSGGVPEPAAWSLMILGFGATGAAIRKRRRTARA
jgi:hypothetical protein